MPHTTYKVPINSLTFDWQHAPERKMRQHIETNGEWIAYQLPDHVGKGRLQLRNLLTGMQVVRCEIDFNPAMAGSVEQIKDTSITFDEPTLECHSLIRGRIYIEEKVTLNQFMYDTSIDFFRYSRGFDFKSRYDCSHGICATALMVGESVLFALVGAEEGSTLLEQLDLLPQPRAAMKSIPLGVKKTLHDAFASDIPDSMQSIYSQAKSLEYLVLLKDFLASTAAPPVAVTKAAIVRNLYDQLLDSGDNPPSLVDLAKAYGLSAKSLNDLFRQEYRTSIFDFILNQRMNSAYDAVVKTDEPLKQLSRRLGYRHVTNFNTAFKRHFGRTPGSLRKS